MQDPRMDALARLLVRYSLKVKPRQTVSVQATPAAEPLVSAIYHELLATRAYPDVRLLPDALQPIFYRHGSALHFDSFPPLQRAQARYTDASIRILSTTNTRALSTCDPSRQARYMKTMTPLKNILLAKPWVLTLYPTEALAQDAEMSLAEYETFVWQSCFCDQPDPAAAWQSLARRQQALIRHLRGTDEIRILGPDTDLRFSIKGRRLINSYGSHNMPCGEVFTAPLEASAAGHIRYDYPVSHAGREISGLRLVFRKGRVIEASADKNGAFLQKMLDVDPGARRLGEFGIGMNYGIDRFTRNILFDEKIGGSIHLALGSAYTECGGRNRSALHWDMIKDLRRGGAWYADGKLIQKDGRMKIPGTGGTR